MSKLILFLFQLSWAQPYSTSLEPFYDELEGPKLIQALIQDNKLDFAEAEIKQLPSALQKQKILFNIQILNLRNQYEEALQLIQTQSPTQELLYEKAFALNKLKKFKQCASIQWSPHESLKIEQIPVVFDCYYQNENWNLAYHLVQMTQDPSLAHLKWKILIKLNLFKEAQVQLINWASLKFPEDLILNFVRSLPESEKTQALEILKVQSPKSSRIWAEWSANEYLLKRVRSATFGFQVASQLDHEYLFATSELLRSQAQFQQAEYLSSLIFDQETQLKAKISLLIDRSSYLPISALSGPFERSSLIQDQETTYAMVYSLSILQPEKAKRLALKINRADIKAKLDKLFD